MQVLKTIVLTRQFDLEIRDIFYVTTRYLIKPKIILAKLPNVYNLKYLYFYTLD